MWRKTKIIGVTTATVLAVIAISIFWTASRTSISRVGVRHSDSKSTSPPSIERALTDDQQFRRTRERLQRGRYLVEGSAHCFHCHSPLDRHSPGLLPVSGKIGAGKIVLEAGPVRLVAANITPDAETGIDSWNDRELARAIREGISRDGRILIGMPTEEYSVISDEDLASIVVYLRSINPVHNALPKTSVPPEMRKTIQRVSLGTPILAADLSDPVKRGAYYVKIGRCDGCHTPRDQDGNRVRGFEYAGGSLFEGSVAGTNITSDASGISHYNEAIFIITIRTGRVGGIRNLSPMMPWAYFRNMTDDDLKAVYAYLQTLKPVRHRIDNTEPPTLCKRCGQNHGSGHLN